MGMRALWGILPNQMPNLFRSSRGLPRAGRVDAHHLLDSVPLLVHACRRVVHLHGVRGVTGHGPPHDSLDACQPGHVLPRSSRRLRSQLRQASATGKTRPRARFASDTMALAATNSVGWSYAGALQAWPQAPMTRNFRLFALTVAAALTEGVSGCGGSRVGSGASSDNSSVCPAGDPGPVGVLATGQPTPSGLAVDCANVYWINVGTLPATTGQKPTGPYTGGQVMKCAMAGGDNNPTVLASGRAGIDVGAVE